MLMMKAFLSILIIMLYFSFVSNKNYTNENNFVYTLKVIETSPNSKISNPILEDFCIGTPKQCFPVILTLIGPDTLILDKDINYSSNMYDSNSSSTYLSDKTISSEIDYFGSVVYKQANETIHSKNAVLTNFSFHHIIKLNSPSPIKANGVLGLGYGNKILKMMKKEGFIKNATYTYNYGITGESTYLNLSIGDFHPSIYSYKSNFTYCDITSNEKFISFWGCKTDIHINYPDEKMSLLSQPLIIGVTANNLYEGELIFAGMREKYQKFIHLRFLRNSSLCSINNNTTMFECDTSFNYKKVANLQFVMNNFSYVFKPDDLFMINSDSSKYILKISFPQNANDFNHIIINRDYLIRKKITVLYDDDNERIGLLGFHTHVYQGESDDGEPELNNRLSGLIIFLVILLGLIVLAGGAYIIYYCKYRRVQQNDAFLSMNN